MKNYLLSTLLLCTLSIYSQHQLDWVNVPYLEKGVYNWIDDVLVDDAGNTYTHQYRYSAYGNQGPGTVYYQTVIKQNQFGDIVWQTKVGDNLLQQANQANLLVKQGGFIYTVVYDSLQLRAFKLDENTGSLDTVFSESVITGLNPGANYRVNMFTGHNGHIYITLNVSGPNSIVYEIDNDTLGMVYPITGLVDMYSNKSQKVDRNGTLYVNYTAGGSSILRRIDKSGVVLSNVSMYPGPGTYPLPGMLTIDSVGNSYWIANYSIRKLDTAMNTLWTYDISSSPEVAKFKVDENGNLVFLTTGANSTNPHCLKLNAAGGLIFNAAIPAGQETWLSDMFTVPSGKTYVAGFRFKGLETGGFFSREQPLTLTVFDSTGQIQEFFTDTLYYNTFPYTYFSFKFDVNRNGDVHIVPTFKNTFTYAASNLDTAIKNMQVFSWYTARICGRCGANNVSGQVVVDSIINCLADTLEPAAHNSMVRLLPGTRLATLNSKGEYRFKSVLPGSYQVQVVTPDYFTVGCDSAFAFTIDTATPGAEHDFELTAQQGCQMFATISGNRAQAGYIQPTHVTYFNQTWSSSKGLVAVTLDSIFTFDNATTTPDSISGQTLFWKFENLIPYEQYGITIFALTDVTDTAAAMPYQSTVAIYADCAPDTALAADTLNEYVTSAYDPNDKVVYPLVVRDHNEFTDKTQPLTFQINFQNTGSDTAVRVELRDTIDTNFDWSTFRMIAASHNYRLEAGESRNLHWTFDNILLPDSHTNEPLSHGFVKYSIMPVANLQYGQWVTNTAFIYFDFNSPVITNTVALQYVDEFTSAIEKVAQNSFKVYPNPSNGYVIVSAENVDLNAYEIRVFNVTGVQVHSSVSYNGAEARVDLSMLPGGVYFINLAEKQNTASSFLKVVKY